MLKRIGATWRGLMQAHATGSRGWTVAWALLSMFHFVEGSIFVWKHNLWGFVSLPFSFFAWTVVIMRLFHPTEENQRRVT